MFATLKGNVALGRGRATAELAAHRSAISAISHTVFYPGSLNVILKRPCRLDPEKGQSFDSGYRHLWPGRVRGEDVWLYRWRGARLHVVEVLSPLHLRSQFRLSTGDDIAIEMPSECLADLRVSELMIWSVLWAGRREWYYTHERYQSRVKKFEHALGTLQ